MKASKLEMFADFETTAVRVYVKKTRLVKRFKKLEKVVVDVLDPYQSRTFVCAWGIGQVCTNPTVVYGRTLRDFLDYIKNVIETSETPLNLNVFTHNLKFDGAFIEWLALIATDHFTIEDEIRDDQLYSFKLRYKDIDKTVTFRDSSKIFPLSLDKLGSIYGIPKMKGSWDYKKYRDENTEITPDEWKYLEHDVLIGIKALHDYRSRGYMQNTQASIAYNQRLRMTWPKFHKEWVTKFKDDNWEKFANAFPSDIRPLPRPLSIALMPSYLGGVTYVNPLFANVMLDNITSFDINSMYPKQMRDAVLPIGSPKVYKNPTPEHLRFIKAFFPCVIYEIKNLTMKLKSIDNIPIAMFTTENEKTTVRSQGKIIECRGERAVITDIDLEMIQAEYDIENLEIVKAYAFKGRKGIYKKFVDFWMAKKEEATIELAKAKEAKDDEAISKWESERAIAKVMLNCSYGKDGTKLFREKKSAKLVDGLLEFDTSIEMPESEYYLPHAIYITANARRQLYKVIKICGIRHFIYCDTDSIKADQEGVRRLREAAKRGEIEIDDCKLGAWKDEGTYEKAIFVRQKTYASLENGKWHYTACGATKGIKDYIDITEFKPGMTITVQDLREKGLEGKLRPVSVQGGVILEECGFQITEHEGWETGKGKSLPIESFVSYMRGELS